MRILALLAALALSGCAGAPPTDVSAGCPRDVPFWKSWPCERRNMDASPNPQEFKDYYVAIGDVVAERSQAGRITDAEADAVMAKAVLEVNAGIRATRPASVVVPMPTGTAYTAPPAPRAITCIRSGKMVSCY